MWYSDLQVDSIESPGENKISDWGICYLSNFSTKFLLATFKGVESFTLEIIFRGKFDQLPAVYHCDTIDARYQPGHESHLARG